MSAIRGTHREYETIFIMRPDSTDQLIDNVRTRIDDVFERLEGKMVKLDSWGKRKLAYSIRDKTAQKNIQKGLYFYMRYVGANDLVPELERNLRMLEPVLRYMTIKLDDDFNLESLQLPGDAGAAGSNEAKAAAAQ